MIRLSGLEPDKDIPIVFTKPRPGEKLFEEVLTAEAGTLATQNQKIFTAKLSPVEAEKVSAGIENLKELVETREKKSILELLKELVPNYNPEKL